MFEIKKNINQNIGNNIKFNFLLLHNIVDIISNIKDIKIDTGILFKVFNKFFK
jgi:hypothetical protein